MIDPWTQWSISLSLAGDLYPEQVQIMRYNKQRTFLKKDWLEIVDENLFSSSLDHTHSL